MTRSVAPTLDFDWQKSWRCLYCVFSSSPCAYMNGQCSQLVSMSGWLMMSSGSAMVLVMVLVGFGCGSWLTLNFCLLFWRITSCCAVSLHPKRYRSLMSVRFLLPCRTRLRVPFFQFAVCRLL